jgi:hypothetical protein
MEALVKKIPTTIFACCIGALLVGCATNWVHPRIPDQAASARQLTIDDGYCTMVSIGAAPMPPVIQSNAPTTSYVTGTGSTYNSTTGQRTTSTYTGQATNVQSGGFGGGFSSGFASGASAGAAIRAAMEQERIHDACMVNKGWVDGDKFPVTQAPKTRALLTQPPSPLAYSDSNAQWKADVDEFLNFYPGYKAKASYTLLDKRVKSIANSKDMPRGSQYLLTAQEQLSQEGLAPKADDKDPGGLRGTYIAAVKGDASQQSALALAYVQRKDERTLFNPKRAEYWSRESALQGNPVGQMGYGIILFQLGDKVTGYRWVEFAASKGADIGDNLNRFRANMNEGQLIAIQR